MVSLLEAKGVGSPSMRPSTTALSIVAASAGAKTSAGAPLASWLYRSAEPAKLNSISRPGFSAVNCRPISVKARFSEDAAKTTAWLSDAPGDPHPLSAMMRPAAASLRAWWTMPRYSIR